MSFAGFEEELKPEFEPKTSHTKKASRDKLIKAAVNRKVEAVYNVPAEARLQPKESPSKVQLAVDKQGHCEILNKPPGIDSSVSAAASASSTQASTSSTQASTSTTQASTSTASTTVPESLSKTIECAPMDPRQNKLEEFQFKQKLIEEQNRKRRELLNEAINSRKQQTDRESRKLLQVQQELAKIDVMLTTDVRFLRDSIEQASLVFMEAQKRYDRAEKEFVEAKLHLFSSLERKELLTDHLCTIIEQNELRKARRLEELMVELSLNSEPTVAQNGNLLSELRTAQDPSPVQKSEN